MGEGKEGGDADDDDVCYEASDLSDDEDDDSNDDAADVSINASDDKSKTPPIEEQNVVRPCSGPVIKPYNWDTMSERENISGLLLFAADSTPLKEKFCD